jgi:hypothetical protein
MIARISRALAIAGLVLTGALGPGTTAAAGWGPVAASSGGTRVTVSPPTTTVSAHVGDTVVVQLTACAGSCGYVWKVTSAPSSSVVRYLSTTFRDQAPAGPIGGYQTELLTYRAVHAGSTSGTFSYFPPGTGAAATQTYTLTFNVSDVSTFSTAAKSGSATAAGIAQLWRIRTGLHPSYDRVVFDERNATSGYLVKYVPTVVADGSGRPLYVRGRYFLQVTMYSTSTQAMPGAPTYVRAVMNPRLPRVMQIKKTGEFEQVVTFVIGVRQAHGFRVLQLTNPNRLVVDVRH